MSEAPSADVFKATSAVILFSIAAAGGILPQRLQNVGSKVVSCLNTAAGGVFFASAMVHMLPESSETLSDAWGDGFPWGGFLCALGFLLILCIDQAVTIANANRKRKTSHVLIPTEPPDMDNLSNSLVDREHHVKTDLEEFAEIMSGISPRDLLDSSSSSTVTDPVSSNGSLANRVVLMDSRSRQHHHQHHQRQENNDRDVNNSGALDVPRSDRALSEDDDDAYHHLQRRGGGGSGGKKGAHHGAHGSMVGSSSNGHDGHSHGLGAAGDGVWVRLALLLALSVHSVMEGLGVGAKSTKAYNLLFAIGVHKGLAAYALGASLLQSGVRGNELRSFVLAFSAMTPAGILLGAVIEKDGDDDTAGAVCVALAAGTFLYVSLMEVLPPELSSTEHGWLKMATLLAGFFLSAGVGWLVG